MIIGIGSDLVNITRIKMVMDLHGQRFIDRCFTAKEIEKASIRNGDVNTYAKRFAAKEACSKALGTGFNHGVYMKDIGVVNDQNGKPVLELTNGALKRLVDITPNGKEMFIHLTLTDEPPLAQAFVVIEAN